MRILIVEDELVIQKNIAKGLRKLGYAVDTASDGNEALYLAGVNFYDLMILDLNLPGRDGIDVLKEIRSSDKNLKILILSARSAISDKIEGLDHGANDFLEKPFHFMELEARMRALLRRRFIQENALIPFFGFVLDTGKKEVRRRSETVHLTKKEYGILEYLVLHRGKTITPQSLIDHVWEDDADLYLNSFKVHINTLKKKLGGEEGIIQNSRSRGYYIPEEENS